MDKRKKLIIEMRAKRMSYRSIGKLLGISRQRVHQIASGHISLSRQLVPPKKHRLWTVAKRKTLGLPTATLPSTGVNGGRDFIRELVRIRDKHTCQICLKRWVPGTRRFDVHHQNERQEGTSAQKYSVRRDKKSFDQMITLCHRCHLNLDSVKRKVARGKRHARILTALEREEVMSMIRSGSYLLKDIAKKYGVTTMSISRYNRLVKAA